MRRTLALLSLLAIGWPHVAALECALAEHSTSAIGGSERAVSAHGSHGHATSEPTGGHEAELDSGHPGSEPRTGDCSRVMACAVVMIRTQVPEAHLYRAAPPAAGPTATIDAPVGTIPVVDPPPPRRTA